MKKTTILITFLLLINGCGKDDNSSTNYNLEEQTIEGKVVLPEGTNLNISELSVQSYIDNSSINSESYSINIPKKEHSFTFLSDANNRVVLMGYNYPNQTDFDINAESTIIALALSMPIVSVLTDEAKVDFISEIKQNSNFSSVVSKMEELIINGNSPLDTNQDQFLNAFMSMFEDTLTSKTSKTKLGNDEPVNILLNGNKITFQNAGKFYETTIGIYKENERIEYIELDRIQLFANSASEAFRIANNLATADLEGIEIVEKAYEFKEDGQYQIKIGTGFDSSFSYENREALFDNISKWSMDFFLAVVPLKGNKECAQHVLSEIRAYTTLYLEGRQINTVADVLSLAYDISQSVIKNLAQGIKCLSKNSEFLKFSSLAKALLKWDSWVARIGTSGNISFGISQWILDDSSMELCYRVNENQIIDCRPTGLYIPLHSRYCGANNATSGFGSIIDNSSNPIKPLNLFTFAETTSNFSLNENNLSFEINFNWSNNCGSPNYNYKFTGVLDGPDSLGRIGYTGTLILTVSGNDENLDFCDNCQNIEDLTVYLNY